MKEELWKQKYLDLRCLPLPRTWVHSLPRHCRPVTWGALRRLGLFVLGDTWGDASDQRSKMDDVTSAGNEWKGNCPKMAKGQFANAVITPNAGRNVGANDNDDSGGGNRQRRRRRLFIITSSTTGALPKTTSDAPINSTRKRRVYSLPALVPIGPRPRCGGVPGAVYR